MADHSAAERTPRICLLTETFYPVVGGGETHARLLAQHLNLLGMSTFVLTRRSDPGLASSDMVSGIPTCRVRPTGMKRFGKYLMVPFVLAELIRRRSEYDVVFVCGFRVLGMPAVIAAKLLRKSCVLRAEAQGEMSGAYASAYRKLPIPIALGFRAWIGVRNWVLRRADAYVAISRPVAEEFIECRMDARRITELPNGIDVEAFTPSDRAGRRSLREKLGLPVNAAMVSYSGKLNQGKGLEYLLRAWTEVASSHTDAHLVLIGSGGGQSLSCEDELRAFVRDHGLASSVTFTGYVENVPEYLQASDLFVLPTENEAFGLSLVEAMACGLPAIASDVGGVPEIVDHLENGILVPPADPDVLAREIVRLLDNSALSCKLSVNARRTVCERFSIQAVANRYYPLFSLVYSRTHALTAVLSLRSTGTTSED
jgi:glycosyltransferase involved in cell wall biosynthesis